MDKVINVYLVDGVYQSIDSMNMMDKTVVKTKETTSSVFKFVSSNIVNIVGVVLVVAAVANAFAESDV